MRFIMLLKTAENAELGPPPPELMTGIMQLGEEAMKAGAMLDTAGFAPTAQSVRVTLAGGDITHADGPFTEPRSLASYALYDVASQEEAVKWAERFLGVHRDTWPGWEGEAEIRALFGPADL